MKRNRYDREYDAVRRGAGYDRPKYEFPNQDASIEEQRTARRIADLNEDFKARMAVLDKADRKQAEETAARWVEFKRETDQRIMLQEWSRAGVEPPVPLCSLELALSLGCRIEEVCGEKILKIPDRKLNGTVKRREDYGNVDGS